MYFQIKSILKSNRYYNTKRALKIMINLEFRFKIFENKLLL
jgi:hypothetical protein